MAPLCSARRSRPFFMQVSIPNARMSTFMKRSASISSLSHSTTCRFSMAAGSIGTRSSSRSWVRTKPPGCWLRCRGAPMSCRARSRVRRKRRSAVLRLSCSTWSFDKPCSDQPQTWPESAEIKSSGRPSALPTSRSAPLVR